MGKNTKVLTFVSVSKFLGNGLQGAIIFKINILLNNLLQNTKGERLIYNLWKLGDYIPVNSRVMAKNTRFPKFVSQSIFLSNTVQGAIIFKIDGLF